MTAATLTSLTEASLRLGPITTDVHSLESNREHLLPSWAFPSKIYKMRNSIGFRVLFEHSFSPIHRYFFRFWPTDEKKCVWRKPQKCRALACLAIIISDIFCAEFDDLIFSSPIVISDISLQPICIGYSDILNVFLRL